MQMHTIAVSKFKARSIALPSKGFTLVITISLLMLLVVLAIGLLSLSSLSLRNSTRGEAFHQALSRPRKIRPVAKL
jgi:Tfp pilus assembly protein PilX